MAKGSREESCKPAAELAIRIAEGAQCDEDIPDSENRHGDEDDRAAQSSVVRVCAVSGEKDVQALHVQFKISRYSLHVSGTGGHLSESEILSTKPL